MHRRQRALSGASVSVVLVAIFAAACTAPSGGGPTSAVATPTSPPAGTATVGPLETSMAEGVTVELREDGMYGAVLEVDGRSVYLFTPDPAGGTGTACLEGCIGNWPAVLVPEGSEPQAGAGLTGALTTFERPDGGRQVAYAGHPLYFFANDPAPGDVNGQGVGGVWYLVTSAGEAVKEAAAATTAPQGTEDSDPLDY